MPFDISLLSEQELRPWAETKELDEAVDAELHKINESMNFNMAMKNAGHMGYSELDEEMPEFKDFKEMVERPGWMGFDEQEEGEEEVTDKTLEEIIAEYENSEKKEVPMNDTIELMEDPIINQAIGKLNNITTKMTRGRLAKLRRMNLLPIETMRKQKAKKKMASVKHNPHLSMSPVMRAQSARTLDSRNGLRSSGGMGMAFEPNIDVDFFSLQGNDENSLFEQEMKDPIFAPPDPNLPILDVLIPKDAAEPSGDEDLKAAKKELMSILGGNEKKRDGNQSNPSSAGQTITGPLLDSLEEGGRKLARPSSSLASITPTKGFHMPQTAPAGSNELPALYESPEKNGRNPPVSPQLKPLSKSQSEGALKLQQGGTKRRPSTGIPSSARGSARGSGRRDDLAAPSGALAKLGIGTNTSSNTLSKKEEFIIDKKKLKKVRTFRDQLLTIAGTMGAYGRENDGTVMESAIDKEAARKESIALTQKMCSETMERNR